MFISSRKGSVSHFALLVVLLDASNIQHVVAAHQHFAQVASAASVDVLLRVGQLKSTEACYLLNSLQDLHSYEKM